jgi:predicted DNA-binding transcriptional regulator YafY
VAGHQNAAEKSDKKLERLLNLVLALLSTKNYLTKSQIVSAIPGYEGTAETKDRMFERDKDDLRQIGIEIEVRNLDPLFEDEVGYRINRNRYGIQIPSLSAEEGLVSLLALSLASQNPENDEIRSTWLKICSVVDEGDALFGALISPETSSLSLVSDLVSEITTALRSVKVLRFSYTREIDGLAEMRWIEPLRLSRTPQGWLLTGWDRTRSDLRNFLVDNIDDLQVLDETFSSNAHQLPSKNIDLAPEVIISAPEELADALRFEGGRFIHSDSGLVRFSMTSFNVEELLRILIGLDSRIIVIEPKSVSDSHSQLLSRMHDAIR